MKRATGHLMGTFAVLPLGELVEILARRKLSGTLSCERGTVRKSVLLAGGAAVGAASNDPREFLGQLLINFGHIDEEQLTKAFETQEQTHVRLGKVLTMVGLVAPEVIREVLAIKIRETLLDVFLWDSGLFTFEDGLPAPVDELDAEVPLGDIGREAEFRATAWNAFRGEFPTGAAALEIDEPRVPAAATPGTVDGRLLALAREGKTIDEIGLSLHATDFHLYQRLYALARQGALRSAPLVPTSPIGADAGEAADLAERSRGLLADGRPEDAELVAARAVALSPHSAVAREALAKAESVLSARLRAALFEPPQTPWLRVPASELSKMRLSSEDKYLLSRCDGRRNVKELSRIAPLRELTVLKAVRRFADAGLVLLGGPPG